MPKSIYQVHLTIETADDKSDDGELHGTDLIKTHKYVIANSITEAKLKAFGKIIEEDDEVYALQVCEQTLKDEITHCKEIIAFWTNKSNRIKESDYRYIDIIKTHQKEEIEFFGNLLKELYETHC